MKNDKRTYYALTENGRTRVTKRPDPKADKIRARSLREAILKVRIQADRDHENRRVSRIAERTAIGSAMLAVLGPDTIRSIRGRF